MDKDLLGFACEFVPAFITPKAQRAASCRPRFNKDLCRCPGAENCRKPEANRARQTNEAANY